MSGRETANSNPVIQGNGKEKTAAENIQAIPKDYIVGIRDLIKEAVAPLYEIMKNNPGPTAPRSNKEASHNSKEKSRKEASD